MNMLSKCAFGSLLLVAAISRAEAQEVLSVVIPDLPLVDILDASADAPAQQGPAPGLTAVRVYAVASPQAGVWELISVGQISTSLNHGGSFINVAVYERGYGSNTPVAKMNGSLLAASRMYGSDQICGEVGGKLVRCGSGQTVIGMLKYWNLPASTGGTFTYSNFSQAGTPSYGTKSVFINIR